MDPRTLERTRLYEGKDEAYRDKHANQIFDSVKYSLMQSIKNVEDKVDMNNRLARMVSCPIYLNLDSFNVGHINCELVFIMRETYKNIESIKLDQVILPNIQNFEYYDVYMEISELKSGWKYIDDYYQYNLFAKTPSTFTPADKVIMTPVTKHIKFERYKDYINELTIIFRDNNFKKMEFPKSVIKARTLPNTNPIQICYINHGLINGDLIYIRDTILCGEYNVTYIDDNTFSIPYNGANLNDPLFPIINIYKYRILIRLELNRFVGY